MSTTTYSPSFHWTHFVALLAIGHGVVSVPIVHCNAVNEWKIQYIVDRMYASRDSDCQRLKKLDNVIYD
ncbi:hypothetical protein ACOMHN_057638 [Nucella lapillus]